MRYALLTLLLTGCVNALPVGSERPPNSDDMRVIDATRDAWIAAGQPWGSQCESEYATHLVVIRSDQQTMRDGSGYCASKGPCCGSPEKQRACGCQWAQGAMGCAAGTMIRDPDVIAPIAALTHDWRILVFVSAYETPETQARLIAHEYVHSLGLCSGLGSDRLHTVYPSWWGAQGIESAAW